MLKLINIIRITTIVMTWMTGIILNASIVAVYIGGRANGQQFSVCDKIFLSTALLNIVQQCFISANDILYYYALYVLSAKEMYILLYISNCSLIYGSFWYSAWLSIYYFLTLVKCSHHFFFQLKKTLSSSIVQILITTLLVIVFLNVPCIWAMGIAFPQNETINQSGSNYQITINLPFTLINLVCGCCIPFLATLFCIGQSVASLLDHVRRVHQNVSQFTSSPQIQGLLRAARTMTLQLVLKGTPSSAKKTTIIMSFPSAQAMTLVLGNPKLRDGLFCRAVPSRV
ncbi:taste receptor type 2 member 40-like [Hyperolius riggenbachi]|uniref:taste receptor type 2 member 40-like n=1 Tax=Hyperolius riggenbachi TaxID=752182 RepID=UPI0035A2D5F5